MGKINLLIANAGETFTDKDIALIENAQTAAEKFISSNFDFDYEVDALITSPSYLLNTIPEDGISGHTYNSRLIAVVIDKKQAAMKEDAVFETVVHEMAHSLRWEKQSEYSDTMFKSMIFEGLAVALEEKAIEDTGRDSRQYFMAQVQATDQVIIDTIMAELADELDKTEYDYNTIFYTGNDKLPRWTGYRLGYYFVKKYLAANDKTINEATLSSYNDFKDK